MGVTYSSPGVFCLFVFLPICHQLPVIFVTSGRVYPAGEGTSQDRLCCCQAVGDESFGHTRTRQSAAILK